MSAALGVPIVRVDRGVRPHRRAPRRPRVRRVHRPARRALRDRGRDRDPRGTLAGTPGLNTGLLGDRGAASPRWSGPPARRCSSSARAPRQLGAQAQGPRRRLLHLRGEQRGRPAHAARRPAALPRLPARRAVPLDAAPLARVALRERRAAGALLRGGLDHLPQGGPRDAGRPRRGRGRSTRSRSTSPGRTTSCSWPAWSRGAPRRRLGRAPARRAGGGDAAHGRRLVAGRPPRGRSAHENGFTWGPIVEVAVDLRRDLRDDDPGARAS